MSDLNLPGEDGGIMGDEVPAGDGLEDDDDARTDGDLGLGGALAPPD